jgi:hypothetical protein
MYRQPAPAPARSWCFSGASDCTSYGVDDLCQPVPFVIRIGSRRTVIVNYLGSPVERVVAVSRYLALAVGKLGQVAAIVVQVAFGLEKRIPARRQTIHVVECVRRGATRRFRIGDTQEIAIGIVTKASASVHAKSKCIRSEVDGQSRCVDRYVVSFENRR